MHRSMLLGVILAGVLLARGSDVVVAGVVASGDSQFIPCPVESVRAQIVTKLPKSWWQTPQEGSVVKVKVEKIGGARTLVCHYQAYGRTVPVMHAFPKGAKKCSPRKNSFDCR